MPTINRQLFLKVGTTSQLVGQIVGRQVEPVGIPAFLLALLTHICDHQPVTPSLVSAASGAPLTTLRDNVQRLVDRGLVKRLANPDDGRSYLLEVTPKGRRLTAEAGEALRDAYELLEAELGELRPHERRLDELNSALAAVLARL
jgi:DNA-binding MarR family transcriptional regulator